MLYTWLLLTLSDIIRLLSTSLTFHTILEQEVEAKCIPKPFSRLVLWFLHFGFSFCTRSHISFVHRLRLLLSFLKISIMRFCFLLLRQVLLLRNFIATAIQQYLSEHFSSNSWSWSEASYYLLRILQYLPLLNFPEIHTAEGLHGFLFSSLIDVFWYIRSIFFALFECSVSIHNHYYHLSIQKS